MTLSNKTIALTIAVGCVYFIWYALRYVFPSVAAVLLTLVNLTIIFVFFISRNKKGNTNLVIRSVVESLPIYFFLSISIFAVWRHALPEFIYFESFTFFDCNSESKANMIDGTWAITITSLVLLILFATINKPDFNLGNKLSDLWLTEKGNYTKTSWLITFYVLFFATGSFVFFDLPRYAKQLAVQETTIAKFNENSDLLVSDGMSTRTFNETGEFIRLFVYPFACALIAVFALVFTGLKTNEIIKQTDNATKTLINERKQVTSGQFQKAVEHFCGNNEHIKISGIYAMNNIAEYDKDDYARVVLNILCACFRSETSSTAYQQYVKNVIVSKYANTQQSNQTNSHLSSQGTSVFTLNVAKIIIDTLFINKNNDTRIYDHMEAILREAVFIGLDLRKALFQGADLWRADFSGVWLAGADFRDTKLQNANFTGAGLYDIMISETTNLRDCDFCGVQSVTKVGRNAPFDYIRKAAKENQGLTTELFGVDVYENGVVKKFKSDDEKKHWFIDKKAKIEDLSVSDVKKLAEKIGLIHENTY